MNLSDIKSGYLLKVETDGEIHYMTVVNARTDDQDEIWCCTPGKHWWPLSEFNAGTLTYRNSTILAVYGPAYAAYILDNSPKGRRKIWERKSPKKMTVAEIIEVLGFDVEIVK